MRLPLAFLLLLCVVPCAAQEVAAPALAQAERPEESAAPEAAPATPVAPVAKAEAVVPVAPPKATQAPVRWTAPRNEGARLELEAVDARIRELRLEMPRLGGPITMLAVGGAAAFISAYAAFVVWFVEETDSYYNDYDHRQEDRPVLIGLGAATLVGLGVLAGGGVWLKRRLDERREYKPELDSLRYRRKQLLRDVRLGANVHGQHYGLSLSAKF